MSDKARTDTEIVIRTTRIRMVKYRNGTSARIICTDRPLTGYGAVCPDANVITIGHVDGVVRYHNMEGECVGMEYATREIKGDEDPPPPITFTEWDLLVEAVADDDDVGHPQDVNHVRLKKFYKGGK